MKQRKTQLRSYKHLLAVHAQVIWLRPEYVQLLVLAWAASVAAEAQAAQAAQAVQVLHQTACELSQHRIKQWAAYGRLFFLKKRIYKNTYIYLNLAIF